MESLFDALKEAIKDKDEEYLRQTLSEAYECNFSKNITEKLDRISALLDEGNFDEMKKIIE